MKKMQSYRIDAETIKQIDEIAKKTMRTKSNVIEVAIKKSYQELRGENEMIKEKMVNVYKAYAINGQGANCDVGNGDEYASYQMLEKIARNDFGSGWKIVIYNSLTGDVVKEFKIR